jgi:hypothetical protein
MPNAHDQHTRTSAVPHVNRQHCADSKLATQCLSSGTCDRCAGHLLAPEEVPLRKTARCTSARVARRCAANRELGGAEDLGVRSAQHAGDVGRAQVRCRFGQRVAGHPPGRDAAPVSEAGVVDFGATDPGDANRLPTPRRRHPAARHTADQPTAAVTRPTTRPQIHRIEPAAAVLRANDVVDLIRVNVQPSARI